MSHLSEEQIRDLVLAVIQELNLSRAPDQPLQVHAAAPIFGQGSPLDSLELVALVMEIEDAFAERGFPVSLNDERAISQQQSPFRDVPSLVSHLRKVLADAGEED